MLLYVSILVLISGLGLAGCRQAPKLLEPDVASPSSTGVTVSAAPALPDLRVYGWQEGHRYLYRMRMCSKISLGEKSALYDFDLTGIVELAVTSLSPEAVSFHVAIDGGKFQSRIPGSQPQFDKLTSELKRPYFFEMKAGKVAMARMPKETHPMAAAVFRTLSSSFQFVRTQTSERTFTATEYDTTGQYVAEYAQQADKLAWQKRKQKYLEILLPKNHNKEANEVVPEIVQSLANIRLSVSGIPDTIESKDELLLPNAQAPLRSIVETSLRLETSLIVAHAAPDWNTLRARTVAVAIDAPFESELNQTDLDDAKIDGMTFETVLAQLEKIAERTKIENALNAQDPAAKRAALQKQAADESKLFIALGAILRRQPAAVHHALKKIQAKSAATDIMVDGLGSADSTAAQQALLEVIRDGANDDKLRMRALISLSRTEHPASESINALTSFADDELLGAQSLYGIGNYSRLLKAAGRTDEASKLGDFLIQRMSAVARSEEKLIVVLRAIGVSGHLPALARVKSFLVDQREQLRVDAVRALGSMESSDIDRTLVETVSKDRSKLVRMAAIEAMTSRTPSDELVAGLKQASTEPDPHVRFRAVDLMIRWLPKRVELRESIELVAKNDEERKIRERAKAAL